MSSLGIQFHPNWTKRGRKKVVSMRAAGESGASVIDVRGTPSVVYLKWLCDAVLNRDVLP